MLCVIAGTTLALGGICRGDTTEYIPDVTHGKGKVTGGEKNDQGFEWRNMVVTASDNKITVSFEFKTWNDNATPITQLFLCIHDKVYLTLYNGVPKAKKDEDWRTVKKTFEVAFHTPGATHKMTLALPQEYSVEDAIKKIEVEGMTERHEFGTLTAK